MAMILMKRIDDELGVETNQWRVEDGSVKDDLPLEVKEKWDAMGPWTLQTEDIQAKLDLIEQKRVEIENARAFLRDFDPESPQTLGDLKVMVVQMYKLLQDRI